MIINQGINIKPDFFDVMSCLLNARSKTPNVPIIFSPMR